VDVAGPIRQPAVRGLPLPRTLMGAFVVVTVVLVFLSSDLSVRQDQISTYT
jgi:hypothetical protein